MSGGLQRVPLERGTQRVELVDDARHGELRGCAQRDHIGDIYDAALGDHTRRNARVFLEKSELHFFPGYSASISFASGRIL